MTPSPTSDTMSRLECTTPVCTTALIQPFPRRRRHLGSSDREDEFQQISPSTLSTTVRVNKNRRMSLPSCFLYFNIFFLLFGYFAQKRLLSAAFRFGHNVLRWRRKPGGLFVLQRFPINNWLLLFHLLSLIAFGCAAAVSSTGSDSSSTLFSPLPQNPLLKHRRESDFRQQQNNICRVWTKHAPQDLCSRSRWSRLRLMREISLFSRDCQNETDNVQLGEYFRLDWQSLRSEADLVERSEHLQDGTHGRSCILAEANSDECLRCFSRVGAGLETVNRAYQAFDRVLHRFDCGLAVDSSSATRPFSPNGTCSDCKRWYRKWLLVQLVDVWREPACINWCYYAQLACPHLATIKVVDFAGHPTFLCRDLDIPQQDNEQRRSLDGVFSCKCVHPCDLSRLSTQELEDIRVRNQAPQQTIISYDFFAAEEHCAQRQMRCDKERAREAALSDGFDNYGSPMSNSIHRGFVEEQPDEIYSHLISDRSYNLPTTTLNDHSMSANELPIQQRKHKKRRQHHDEISSGIAKAQPLFYFLILIIWPR